MGCPVVHFEFWSEDPKKVSAFYEKAFGWQIRHIPEMSYHLIETGGQGGINGGIFTPKQGPWPGNQALYIDVDDLAAYVKKVRDAGGKILIERQEVAEVGEFALFEDPDGRVNGLWHQLKK